MPGWALAALLPLVVGDQVLTQAPLCEGVFFATFNIQNYGNSKASKSEVLTALAEILARYDLVTIQEISQLPDETGTCGLYTESAICDLQAAAAAARGHSFSLVVSPRIGDEQYAIMYDPLVVNYLGGDTYPDNASIFSRPPYAFHVHTGGISVALASTHTAPSAAEQEIAAFPQVIRWMEATFAADVYMVAGDFNADGSYFDEDSSWSPILAQIPNYTLLTGNEMDTTVSVSSNAYDRILASSTLQADPPAVFVIENHVNLTGVFNQGCADGYISSSICNAGTVEWLEVTKELSDHYPVEVCMHLNGTSCTTCSTTPPLPDLGPGDCAVVGFAADNPDNFGVLLLTTLSAGHRIMVTDEGVQSDGTFRDGEGLLQFDAEEEVAAGTVLVLANFSSAEGSFALSSSGDQVIVFTGGVSSPTFLCAINFEGPGGWQADADSTAQSALPTGLEDAALALSETDNAGYAGPTAGTVEELRQWVNNATFWTSSNTQAVAFPVTFTIHTTSTTTLSTSTTTTVATSTTTVSTTHTTSTATLSTSTTTTVATSATTVTCTIHTTSTTTLSTSTITTVATFATTVTLTIHSSSTTTLSTSTTTTVATSATSVSATHTTSSATLSTSTTTTVATSTTTVAFTVHTTSTTTRATSTTTTVATSATTVTSSSTTPSTTTASSTTSFTNDSATVNVTRGTNVDVSSGTRLHTFSHRLLLGSSALWALTQ